MNTRRTTDHEKFRQERFMSSPEHQRGLLANCVAARVATVGSAEHRKLIWWLQKASWEAGGIEGIADDMLSRWPERFVTLTMKKMGLREKCTPSEAKNIEREIYPHGGVRSGLEELLDGEEAAPTRRRSDYSPICLEQAKRNLGTFLLREFCLDPSCPIREGWPWFCASLVPMLTQIYEERSAKIAAAAPVTEIGRKIGAELDYALAEPGLVIVDGMARIGKTFAVKAWCDARPGEARYVQVPSSNDDITFFRVIADAIGLGSSHKALELRARVEAVLHTRDLLMVFDEGHYLWPQRNLRLAIPHRINWIMTQLLNMDVRAAIVTTPQFSKNQDAVVKSGGWSQEQLVGRVSQYTQLPTVVSQPDLEAVARHWMPSACQSSIDALVAYAEASGKQLQGIQAVARRARYVAAQCGRDEPNFVDVKAAITDGVVPSDEALGAALSGKPKARRPAPASRQQSACKPASAALPRKTPNDFPAPDREIGAAVLSP